VPAIISWLTVQSGSWWGFFGIGFYFVGLIISTFRQWIFLPIPILFCLWYWYTYGFSVHDYVSTFFACIITGVVLNEISKQYYKFVDKILPEQINNIEYNEKVDELNKRLEKYRLEHPSEKLTPDVVEKIRAEVFF
jgi:uncharacterized membrane-anchored protein YitT (DUF2179 family)